MKKKEYFQPTNRVITLEPTSLLADSGSTKMLESGVIGDPDEPERDEYGWVSAESRNYNVFDNEW